MADNFAVRWKPQVSFPGILCVIGFSPLFFLMIWAGYKNGHTPKFWGDPISFADAIAKLPRILVFVLIAAIIWCLVTGIRSEDDSSSQ